MATGIPHMATRLRHTILILPHPGDHHHHMGRHLRLTKFKLKNKKYLKNIKLRVKNKILKLKK
jgi:hypothetical protein